MYGRGSLTQLHTTREEGGSRVSLEEQRPTDWQGTDMEHRVDLLRSLDFTQIPSDDIDLNQNLLKFRKLYLLRVIEDLKRIKFLPVKIG